MISCALPLRQRALSVSDVDADAQLGPDQLTLRSTSSCACSYVAASTGSAEHVATLPLASIEHWSPGSWPSTRCDTCGSSLAGAVGQ